MHRGGSGPATLLSKVCGCSSGQPQQKGIGSTLRQRYVVDAMLGLRQEEDHASITAPLIFFPSSPSLSQVATLLEMIFYLFSQREKSIKEREVKRVQVKVMLIQLRGM